ncbi:hypothetical protein VNO77_44160 [Canavalia gladiata]|uniref:Uncharacterized protein n=1 Tax=Canavalia gladiata TaxID=3824 RepID=A0AAN9JZ54_CANGL
MSCCIVEVRRVVTGAWSFSTTINVTNRKVELLSLFCFNNRYAYQTQTLLSYDINYIEAGHLLRRGSHDIHLVLKN